jgi:hypothetical protein
LRQALPRGLPWRLISAWQKPEKTIYLGDDLFGKIIRYIKQLIFNSRNPNLLVFSV